MSVPPFPRDYRREPTLLTPQAVHALVRELLDDANTNQTWSVEVAEAFVDLSVTRLSDTSAPLDPRLAREVFGGIRAHWASAPLASVDALCTVLANLGDTRPFLREQLATAQSPAAHAVLAETLAELDRSFADEASTGEAQKRQRGGSGRRAWPGHHQGALRGFAAAAQPTPRGRAWQ